MPPRSSSVSSTGAWTQVCSPAGAVALSVSRFCSPTPTPTLSPIDGYMRNTAAILTLGQAQALRQQPALGRVLLLGIVSASESYFRDTLARLIAVCPKTRAAASTQTLSLGSVYYYDRTDIGYGLLETVSLADARVIQSMTKKITDVDLSGGASLMAALGQFDQICQLRHAAAHAHGQLGAQNAHRLGLRHAPGRGNVILRVDLAALHEAAQICTNTVRAYNLYVFSKTIDKWLSGGELTGVWSTDRTWYAPLFDTFHSGVDGQKPSCAYHSYLDLRKAILRHSTQP
jgi:hypothetical protein